MNEKKAENQGGGQPGPEAMGKSQQGILIYLPTRWLLALVVLQMALLLGPALLVSWPSRRAEPPPGAAAGLPTGGGGEEQPLVFKGRPGQWGQLEYVRINIEQPDEFALVDDREFEPTSWHFPNYTRAQLTAFFNACDLTSDQRAFLTDTANWSGTTNGISLTPPSELILALNPPARTQIYSVLAESEANPGHVWPATFRNGGFDEWFRDSGLPEATVATIRRLTYSRGASLCFADVPELFNRLGSRSERLLLMKTLSRQSTLLMKLRIKPDTDVAALTAYWSRGGRAKDVGPLLESLRKVPGGATVDVAHLMPPFARKRLNTYPFPPTDDKTPLPDCFWTVMNFFNEPPDDRHHNDDLWRKELEEDYSVVAEATFGDLVFFLRSDGTPMHAAVHIADDVVFTKNGGSLNQPWILMKLEDMLAKYPTIAPMRMVIFHSNKRKT
jgi:hypothetical protein